MDVYESNNIINDISRPSWDDIYVDFARLISNRSTCYRLSVGCIIVSENNNKVLSLGYNGNYAGGNNNCDTLIPGNCMCCHSELNALLKMDYNDHCMKKMYITHSPCMMCAKYIINSGIGEVIYITKYRDTKPIELLSNNNIVVRMY